LQSLLFFIPFSPQQLELHLLRKDQINYVQPYDWHQQFAKEACWLLDSQLKIWLFEAQLADCSFQ